MRGSRDAQLGPVEEIGLKIFGVLFSRRSISERSWKLGRLDRRRGGGVGGILEVPQK